MDHFMDTKITNIKIEEEDQGEEFYKHCMTTISSMNHSQCTKMITDDLVSHVKVESIIKEEIMISDASNDSGTEFMNIMINNNNNAVDSNSIKQLDESNDLTYGNQNFKLCGNDFLGYTNKKNAMMPKKSEDNAEDIQRQNKKYNLKKSPGKRKQIEDPDYELPSASRKGKCRKKYSDQEKLIKLYCVKCNDNYGIPKYSNLQEVHKCKSCNTKLLLQCGKCMARYMESSSIITHLRYSCAPKRINQCNLCEYSTARKDHFKRHIQFVHTYVAPEDYENCSTCDRKFKQRQHRQLHERVCTAKIMQCKQCNFQTKYKSMFETHMIDHALHPKIENITKDDVQDLEDDPEVSMSKQEELKVKQLIKAYCPRCDQTKKCDSNNDQNICRKCKITLTYHCKKCPRTFRKMGTISDHIILKHLLNEIKKRQVCSRCGLKFLLYQRLKVHQQTCSKEANIKCAHCEFKTKYKPNLISHLRIKHSSKKMVRVHKVSEKKFICKKCGKGYQGIKGLRNHVNYYCGKEAPFHCAHCTMKSYKKYHLMSHLKHMHYEIFSDEKLTCEYCGKQSINIYRHENHIKSCCFKQLHN